MKEKVTHDFSLRELKLFVKNKKLDDWIFAFLDGPGKNKQMAKGLRLRKENGYHSWIGPLNFPLDKLIRCTGPEDYMEYIEKDTKWNMRVDTMVSGIQNGWEVPALIANLKPGTLISLRDGNHRHEALLRSGKKKYPTLFWFDTPSDRQKFRRKFKEFL